MVTAHVAGKNNVFLLRKNMSLRKKQIFYAIAIELDRRKSPSLSLEMCAWVTLGVQAWCARASSLNQTNHKKLKIEHAVPPRYDLTLTMKSKADIPEKRVYSQGGVIILFADRDLMTGRPGESNLLDFRSHRLTRLCRSSFVAETDAFKEGVDTSYIVRGFFV